MVTRGLRANEVCSALTISKPTLYRWISNGKFPPGIKIGASIRIWLESDINEFLVTKTATEK